MLAGNFVTKVIYLPDPEFQELALAGVETLVSTRLDPGVDPIVEADRRGSILAVIRLGNKDVELAGGEGGFGGFGGGGWRRLCCPAPYGGRWRMPMGGLVPNYVAGVTAPQYGMPYVGTPIGLPGPPHIPLGGPAGLQKHVMKNHTHMHIPDPAEHVEDSRPPAAGLELSEAGEPRAHPRADDPPEPAVRAAALGHARADSGRGAVMALRRRGYCPPGQGTLATPGPWIQRRRPKQALAGTKLGPGRSAVTEVYREGLRQQVCCRLMASED